MDSRCDFQTGHLSESDAVHSACRRAAPNNDLFRQVGKVSIADDSYVSYIQGKGLPRVPKVVASVDDDKELERQWRERSHP